ncbi:NUDIX domain-containing protein [Halorussus gelatinilyticus]|uniref:NUDIX domain-containing protein n=1 Tax=Halorussus gelatinilyticus TaxID=2937524 RepID=A0A8U0IHJ3_9EURY|nr:NUDIX domain-containing protein [Halorussus gelatinilyticus]UPW00175.1 NUDIX domain-containing protein [Halorussus gelatinilyticus]
MTDDTDQSDDAESTDENHFVGKITQKAILFGPDGDVLVTRVGDHWEPPGGRFDVGETLVGGLRRELREEVGLDARVGPPVAAVYGGWLDGETANPMVTLIYRCETDERGASLNHEHDDYEWVPPETAADRLAESLGERVVRAVERAAALGEADGFADGDSDGTPADDSATATDPFAAVADPYADVADATTEEMLAELAAARAADGPEDLDP